MRQVSLLLLATGAAVFLLLPACGQRCAGADPRVVEHWKLQRAVVIDYSRIGSAEFREANNFFRALTGIAIRYDYDYIGPRPNGETEIDLREIDHWFDQNCSVLHWVESEKRVEVKAR